MHKTNPNQRFKKSANKPIEDLEVYDIEYQSNLKKNDSENSSLDDHTPLISIDQALLKENNFTIFLRLGAFIIDYLSSILFLFLFYYIILLIFSLLFGLIQINYMIFYTLDWWKKTYFIFIPGSIWLKSFSLEDTDLNYFLNNNFFIYKILISLVQFLLMTLFFTFQTYYKERTFGKKIFKLFIFSDCNKLLNFRQLFLRNILRLTILPIFGILINKNRSFHNIISGTVVITKQNLQHFITKLHT